MICTVMITTNRMLSLIIDMRVRIPHKMCAIRMRHVSYDSDNILTATWQIRDSVCLVLLKY